MRLLLDENVSPSLAERLTRNGHDAVHVNQVGLGGVPDAVIMLWAAQQRRTVVTHDHDFVDNLWSLRAAAPSVIKLSQRGDSALIGVDAHERRLREVLPDLQRRLRAGAIVVLDRDAVHAERLPLGHRLERARGR